MMVASTGTGGMEAAVTNTLSRGDRVIVVNGGKFGERWGEIATTFGLQPTLIDVEWGTGVDPARVKAALDEHPDAKAVLVQWSETSTTALHPVETLAALTRDRDCLLIVDGITSVGVIETAMDANGIDVVVTGSQKALMLPPGLALIGLSEKAWKFNGRSDLPRYYLDLAKERDALEDDTSAYTPATAMVTGLNAVFELIDREGGLAEVYRRHDILARATRAGVEAMGLRLLAPASPSPATTGVWLPDGVEGGKLVKYLRDVMGVTVAGGQGKLKGKIIRLAHIGYADTFDVVVGLSAVEMGLAALGHRVEFGKATAAAQEILLEMYSKDR
jgi:aspartate aminotransferase-like enzyme